jgi:subtilisin family serine protease
MKIFRLFSMLFVLSYFIIGSCVAQDHFSAYAKEVFARLKPHLSQSNKTTFLPAQLMEQYLLESEPEGITLGAIIQVNNRQQTEAELNRLGIRIHTRAGDIWTLRIPIDRLHEFASLKGIAQVDFDKKLHPSLTEAKQDVGADKAHSGIGLPMAFRGKGVIVGVIDQGFDAGHPTFYDKEGNLRVAKWWNQNDTGTPPQGYSYGREYPNKAAILQAMKDNSPIGHGTHVAGIACGAGDGTTETYTGLAPESEIVWVSFLKAGTNVIDAVKYIFDYAESQGKPVVINMSFGTHDGPHDGTSLVDKGLENLVGSGKILVGALGNEGMRTLHLDHIFEGGADTLRTIPVLEGVPPLIGQSTVLVYGSQEYNVGFVLLNARTGEVAEYVDKFYNPFTAADVDSFTIGSGFEGTTIRVASVKPANSSNNKGHLRISFNSTYLFNPKVVALRIAGKPASKVELWNMGAGGTGSNFTDTLPGSTTVLQGYRQGDNRTTLREIGGSGRSVISVGAYTTKNEYTDITGTKQTIRMPAPIGEIAPFSSRGPAADGRMKPDISAPGNVVASAFSSFDQFSPREAIVANVERNGKRYPFGVYEGTSMASPMVCGAVALLLQVNPKLTVDQVKSILQQTARKDDFTTATDNDTWGWGKLNVYDAIKKAIEITGRTDEAEAMPVIIYPNPASHECTIIYHASSDLTATIKAYNVGGAEMGSWTLKENGATLTLDTSKWSEGMYRISLIASDATIQNHKLVIIK